MEIIQTSSFRVRDNASFVKWLGRVGIQYTEYTDPLGRTYYTLKGDPRYNGNFPTQYRDQGVVTMINLKAYLRGAIEDDEMVLFPRLMSPRGGMVSEIDVITPPRPFSPAPIEDVVEPAARSAPSTEPGAEKPSGPAVDERAITSEVRRIVTDALSSMPRDEAVSSK